MHALSSTISTKIPGRPMSSTTSVAKSTMGSVMEARTSTATATDGGGYRPGASARGHVPVPLFDTDDAARAPARASCAPPVDGVARRRALHPRARGRGVRGGVRRLPRRAPRGRRRQRHRRDHDRAARAGRRARRRGRRPVVHLLRDRRGDPADRRDPGLLRRRPGDVLRHRRDGAGGADPEDEGGRSPSTCSATSRRCAEIEALGVPVLEDAAQAAGSRGAGRAPPGALGDGRDVLVLPLQEPRRLRRRRRGHHDDDAVAERRAHAALPRLARQGHLEHVGYNSRLDELQAAILRVQLPAARRLGERAAAQAGDRYEAAGLGDAVDLPAPTPARAPAWHLYVDPPPAAPTRSRRR